MVNNFKICSAYFSIFFPFWKESIFAQRNTDYILVFFLRICRIFMFWPNFCSNPRLQIGNKKGWKKFEKQNENKCKNKESKNKYLVEKMKIDAILSIFRSIFYMVKFLSIFIKVELISKSRTYLPPRIFFLRVEHTWTAPKRWADENGNHVMRCASLVLLCYISNCQSVRGDISCSVIQRLEHFQHTNNGWRNICLWSQRDQR
jgi:hypothetical protein